MPTTDVSFVQTKVLQTSFGQLVDYLQLCGWFGAVIVNPDGTITINGNLLSSDQMSVLGQAMGITSSST